MGFAPKVELKPVAKRKKAVYDANKREDIIFLDFETFYDEGYTLSSMPTSEYVRDERFEMQIVAVKVGTGKTVLMEEPAFKKWAKKIDWKKYDLVAHNAPFDGFILSDRYGIVPRRYICTLAMARGLFGNDVRGDLDSVSLHCGGRGKIKGALESVKGLHVPEIKARGLWTRFAEYCGQDVDEMVRVFYIMSAMLPPLEFVKIDIFVRMFCVPLLRVNRPRLEKELKREIKEKEGKILTAVGSEKEQAELIKLMGRKAAIEFAKKQIGSKAFVELLEGYGVRVPEKYSIKQKKMVPALSKTDEEFLELLEHPKKEVRDLVEARLSVKSTTIETRAGRMLKATENGKRLPMMLNYYAAHTGRPGGGNKMNPLNLVRGSELRRSIIAPEGHKIIVADSGQIEARVLLWLADDMDGLEDFRKGDRKEDRDPYCKFADKVYGREIRKGRDDSERHVGKVCVLGLGYQMGPPKLQTTFALGALGGAPMFFELSECARIVNLFRRDKPKVVQFWNFCRDRIIPDMIAGREGEWKCIRWEKERIWLPNGMCLKYPGITQRVDEDGNKNFYYLRKGEKAKIYGGLLTENLVQALANVIVTWQMTEIAKLDRLVTMTYDENVWIAKIKEVKKSFERGLKIMQTSPDWCLDLPLFAEGGFDDCYSK